MSSRRHSSPMLPPMVVEGQPLCDPEPLPGRDSSPSRLSGVSGLPPQDVDAIEARLSDWDRILCRSVLRPSGV